MKITPSHFKPKTTNYWNETLPYLIRSPFTYSTLLNLGATAYITFTSPILTSFYICISALFLSLSLLCYDIHIAKLLNKELTQIQEAIDAQQNFTSRSHPLSGGWED
jgi:hypothetical protein